MQRHGYVRQADYPQTRREEPSTSFVDTQRHGALEKRYNMLACHRGKSNEEIIDRVTGLDIVEQSLHGHTRAGEHWSSTHDVRRCADDGCAHMVKLTIYPSILDGIGVRFTLSRESDTGVNRRVLADLRANPGGYPGLLYPTDFVANAGVPPEQLD